MKKKATIIFSTILALGVLWGCSNVKETVDTDMKITGFNLGDTTQINIGDIVLCNDDIDLFVKFDSIASDSRCPYNANCIWEGNAETVFSVTYKKELEEIKLNTSKKMGPMKEIFGFQIELINLSPYPGTMNADTAPKTVDIIVTKI